ncbi:hyaluronidase PH-20-like [Erinaceus europaeus]|uniref:Hyaluronidase n=1 Tax=Erinaceus europaeus TaxID=9365 RepID=A0A1S3AA39_ERIEU|nr:hyaluronidase PH-20-like [Erinaceus europaeus]
MKVLRFKSVFLRQFVGFSGTFQAVLTILLFPMCFTREYRAAPIIPNTTYIWAWNAPTEFCTSKYNVDIDLSVFSLVGSPQKGLTGQRVTLFYVDRLGYYPHVDAKNQSHHGGIPQKGNLQDHLTKATTDINHYLPKDQVGMAVIDWEEWRPLWARNWKPKDIYRLLSVELVKQNNTGIDDTTANNKAKVEFESAGRKFMVETIKLGKRLRPKHYWGYYLFPDCYNHHYNKANYTGHCFDLEKQRNDELSWLWNESTALYPSIYLNTKLNSTPQATLFARSRIWEAIRVSGVRNAQDPLPIFIYNRPVFTDASGEYLTELDLVSTIGESIALGTSGVIMWGSLNLTQSQQSCTKLNNYLKNILNPYIINVTLAAKMCSQVLCYNKGLCTRKNWDSHDYLHLNSENFDIKLGHCERFVVSGEPTLADLLHFSEKFHCSCYSNVTCKERDDLGTLDIMNVCTANNVCIASFLKGKIRGSRYRWKKSSNTSILHDTVSPCATGKDLRVCLKVRCSLGTCYNNTEADCESANWKNTSSHLHVQNKENEATYSEKFKQIMDIDIEKS